MAELWGIGIQLKFLISGGGSSRGEGQRDLDPMVDRRAGGTFRVMEEADLRDRVGMFM